MADVGFIGLGRMGGPMARNLASAGHRVHVFDTDAAALGRAGAAGATTHGAPRDVAARVSALFTALPDDEIVTAAYLGADGVLAGGRAGLVTCDCSTVGPQVSRRIAAAAGAKGITHLDTPMLGSSPQAESGEIFFMVGGDRARLADVQPYLEVMGRRTMHVGPSGSGNQIKLLHNALGAVTAVAVAESLALCVATGVDPRTYYEVVKHGGGMAYSTYFDRRVLRILAGEYDATFTVELMHKDIALAARMAGEALLGHLPIMREALAAYTEGIAHWPSEDFSGVTHVLERRVGRALTAGAP